MTYEEAVKEAYKRWGGEGSLHLFHVMKMGGKGPKLAPYHMVGPNVDTLICEDDEEPVKFGEGATWEQAFADYNRKFKPFPPPPLKPATATT